MTEPRSTAPAAKRSPAPRDTQEIEPEGITPSSLFVRVGSGAVFVVAFIICLLLGTVPTALLVALLSALCCYEFLEMMKRDGKLPNMAIGITASVLFPLSALGESVLMSALLFILVLVCGLWYVQSPRTRISDVAITLIAPLYTGYMLSSVVLIRQAMPGFPGALLTVGTCASLWVSDSCAYLVGRTLGHHKMAPKISPKKTWEGFAGGVLGSVVVWALLAMTGFYDLPVWFAVLCGAVVAVLGVFGDLIESRIKRGVGVKDSGRLMPGHGGMFDRCDSLIFGCITAQLMLILGGVL